MFEIRIVHMIHEPLDAPTRQPVVAQRRYDECLAIRIQNHLLDHLNLRVSNLLGSIRALC